CRRIPKVHEAATSTGEVSQRRNNRPHHPLRHQGLRILFATPLPRSFSCYTTISHSTSRIENRNMGYPHQPLDHGNGAVKIQIWIKPNAMAAATAKSSSVRSEQRMGARK